MKKNFKVSIIMNCHNGEQFLLDSLKSILSQTYKNWELIFFDNFSNDYSKKIFFSFKDKRFKYFYSNKLLNLYHARNIAIQKSKGQLISFLDTDDIWLKKKLEYQIKEIQKKKIDFLYSNFYIKKNKNLYLAYKEKQPEGLVTNQLLENNFVGILTTIFKKKLIEKYNIKFNNCYNIIGDFDYFVNLSKKVKFHYIHKPLAIYRMHKKNYSLLNSKLYLKEINFWYKNNKNNFKKYNFQNFINKKNYFTIKINIINREYKKAIVNLINFPFSLQKLKLFIMFFLSKKNLYL